MSTQKEYPSTYIVQNRNNLEEIKRLEIQDKMVTAGMGGVLPEMANPAVLQRVLDVGCGTGGWLMETAQTYPTIEELVGVDVSSKVIAYARAQAEAKPLDGRVQFQTMDALQKLGFPDAHFDLVNQRAGLSWLRTWDWGKILVEYQRVTRPDGIIRITEFNVCPEYDSPVWMKVNNLYVEAYHRSGRLFTARNDGVTSELERLMTQYGMRDVKSQVHTLVCRAGTVEGQYLYEDALRSVRVLMPFLQKWISVPSNYKEMARQCLREMQQPDFVATWTWVTAWGKPYF